MSADSNIANLLGLARTAQLAGNPAEALGYYNRVLEADPTVSEAWLGKGKAAAWQSTLVNIRINEAVIAFSHAIATAPDAEKATTTAEAVDEVNRLVATLYGMARRYLDEFVALEATWTQYLSQVAQLLDALEEIRKWAPLDRTTLENIVHLCKDNIEGISYNDPYDYNAPKAWHLSPEYEAFLKSRLDGAASGLRQIDPDYAPPAIDKKEASACFVVTATMGDHNHPIVKLMRSFRDEWLVRKSWGRRFIRHYYRVGPPLARVIARSDVLRRLSLFLIVVPCTALIRLVMRNNR